MVAPWLANGFVRTNRPISASGICRLDVCSVRAMRRRSICATVGFPTAGPAGRCGSIRSGSRTARSGSMLRRSRHRRSSCFCPTNVGRCRQTRRSATLARASVERRDDPGYSRQERRRVGQPRPVRRGIASGRFVSIGKSDASATAVLVLDAEGRMAVAGFVEPHIHLDKALISERAPVNVSGTLTEAIEILWEIKRNYTVDEIADRASRVLARAIENGISRLRSHVDVDPIGGTRPAEGLIRARERFGQLMDIQIVAFPQEGIVKSPGTEALMREVMRIGVDVVGG